MSNGISGTAVAVLATGAVLIWSGINNQDVLTSLRSLAMGNPIPAGGQVSHKGARPRGGTATDPIPQGGNQNIVSIAASYKGHPYVFGGGHGTVCPSGGMDCSGFVSCVMNKAGVMRGTLTTGGFAKWGTAVDFDNRLPGDIVVWVGGPGSGHMGIVIDDKNMWHNPCTGCGGVTKAEYGRTRTMRPTIVRRAKVPR